MLLPARESFRSHREFLTNSKSHSRRQHRKLSRGRIALQHLMRAEDAPRARSLRGLGSARLWRAGECVPGSRTFWFFDQRSAPHTVLPLCCAVSIFTVCMPQPANEKLDSAKAKIAWTEYCRRHDVSQRKGQKAGIEPASGRVWIGNSIPDVVHQRDDAGVAAPLWFERNGAEAYLL